MNLSHADLPRPPIARSPLTEPRDVTAEVAAETASNPESRSRNRDFLNHRMRLVAGVAPQDPGQIVRFAALFQDESPTDAYDPPIPGGTGCGCYYADPFRTAYENGSEIQWDIVCPDVLGGNVTQHLYLTATNRTSRGVEALISYDPDGSLHFLVFDWSIPGGLFDSPNPKWTVDLTRPQLQNYMIRQKVNIPGRSRTLQTLTLINSTTETSPNCWRNAVFLFNVARNGWDQVYLRDYNATRNAQREPTVGFWGPIVETFQEVHRGTAPIGALRIQLRSRVGDDWSDWKRLSSSQSVLQPPSAGFRQLLLDPNDDFVVIS